MGEGGDLYRLNPYAHSGEQLEVHDRFWAQAQPHAFTAGRLHLSPGQATGNITHPPMEECAVVATADRVVLSGLFSRQRRALTPATGETFLVNSWDAFQFVVAQGSSLLLLSHHGDTTNFCDIDLRSSEVKRFALAGNDTAVCGPVLLLEADAAHTIYWSANALWVYTTGELTPVALPEATVLCTGPQDAGLRLPPGRSPAIAGSGQVFLAARQFGRPALLRLVRGSSGWATTTVSLLDEGTLGASTAGHPLISATDKLLVCDRTAFRTAVHDTQIATRFPAWGHADLMLFFCQAEYGGSKQWVKAYREGTEIPISWNLPPGTQMHASHGFWTLGTALASLCVLTDRGLRTEFLSWCA